MKNKRPKSYFTQDGCHNCKFVDRIAVASDIYPVCTAYYERFMAEPYGFCPRWQQYVYESKGYPYT